MHWVLTDEEVKTQMEIGDKARKKFEDNLVIFFENKKLINGAKVGKKVEADAPCSRAIFKIVYDRLRNQSQHYVNSMEDRWFCQEMMHHVQDEVFTGLREFCQNKNDLIEENKMYGFKIACNKKKVEYFKKETLEFKV